MLHFRASIISNLPWMDLPISLPTIPGCMLMILALWISDNTVLNTHDLANVEPKTIAWMFSNDLTLRQKN